MTYNQTDLVAAYFSYLISHFIGLISCKLHLASGPFTQPGKPMPAQIHVLQEGVLDPSPNPLFYKFYYTIQLFFIGLTETVINNCIIIGLSNTPYWTAKCSIIAGSISYNIIKLHRINSDPELAHCQEPSTSKQWINEFFSSKYISGHTK